MPELAAESPAPDEFGIESDQGQRSSGPGLGDPIRGTAALPGGGGSVLSGGVSLAGPTLPDAPLTLEWSILSTSFALGTLTEGPGNLLNTDPQLGALDTNCGPTQTMLPNTGSPAINAGDPAVAGAPSGDQRGEPRIVATIDIGAVETPTPPTLPATGSTLSEMTLVAGAAGAVALLGVLALLLLRRRQEA